MDEHGQMHNMLATLFGLDILPVWFLDVLRLVLDLQPVGRNMVNHVRAD